LWLFTFITFINMADQDSRSNLVYMAKLAEEAER